MDLKDKVAVVTGASSGLGKVFSEKLVARGVTVFGLARSIDKLDTLRQTLGDRFHPVGCDVTHTEQVEGAFEAVAQKADQLDILINNAGLGQFGPIDELSVEQWDVQMNTNLRGVFLCTRKVVPVMRKQNEATGFGGHIVNIASLAGLIGNPMLSAYNTTKFGLRGFSEALMKEVRNDGIKVTCVYPGSVATHFADVAGSAGSPNPMQAPDVGDTVIHILEGPDNYLISEVMMRPLRPRG